MIDRLDPESDKVHFRTDTSFWVYNLMISANFSQGKFALRAEKGS